MYPLGIMGTYLMALLKPLDHPSNMVLRGLRGPHHSKRCKEEGLRFTGDIHLLRVSEANEVPISSHI